MYTWLQMFFNSPLIFAFINSGAQNYWNPIIDSIIWRADLFVMVLRLSASPLLSGWPTSSVSRDVSVQDFS